jgi:hypothetical protein
MLTRLHFWLWLLAITFTQAIFNTFGAGLFWAITGRGHAPNPDEPLSARVGRAASAGRRWGLRAERAIDTIFGRGHCRSSRA